MGGMSGLRQVSAGDRCGSGDHGSSVHTELCSSAIYSTEYCSTVHMYNFYSFLLTRKFLRTCSQESKVRGHVNLRTYTK